MSSGWDKYYKLTAGRRVHPLLELALENFKTPGIAYDMGTGAGVETGHLLQQGWTVCAVDNQEASIQFVKKKFGHSENLEFDLTSFEMIQLKKCDFIFASKSFPFCHPSYFNKFWDRMRKSLKKDGVIAGDLFGFKDDWSGSKVMTFQNEKSLIKLFTGFDILFFDEIEDDCQTVMGNLKHWHIYSFILRKI